MEAGGGEYVANVAYRADGNPHEILDERKGLRLGHLRHRAISMLRNKVGRRLARFGDVMGRKILHVELATKKNYVDVQLSVLGGAFQKPLASIASLLSVCMENVASGRAPTLRQH